MYVMNPSAPNVINKGITIGVIQTILDPLACLASRIAFILLVFIMGRPSLPENS